MNCTTIYRNYLSLCLPIALISSFIVLSGSSAQAADLITYNDTPTTSTFYASSNTGTLAYIATAFKVTDSISLDSLSLWTSNLGTDQARTFSVSIYQGTYTNSSTRTLGSLVAGSTITGLNANNSTLTKVTGTYTSPVTLAANTGNQAYFLVLHNETAGSSNFGYGVAPDNNLGSFSSPSTITPLYGVYRTSNIANGFEGTRTVSNSMAYEFTGVVNSVVVPEANTVALLGLALPMIGLVAARNNSAVIRRKK